MHDVVSTLRNNTLLNGLRKKFFETSLHPCSHTSPRVTEWSARSFTEIKLEFFCFIFPAHVIIFTSFLIYFALLVLVF